MEHPTSGPLNIEIKPGNGDNFARTAQAFAPGDNINRNSALSSQDPTGVSNLPPMSNLDAEMIAEEQSINEKKQKKKLAPLKDVERNRSIRNRVHMNKSELGVGKPFMSIYSQPMPCGPVSPQAKVVSPKTTAIRRRKRSPRVKTMKEEIHNTSTPLRDRREEITTHEAPSKERSNEQSKKTLFTPAFNNINTSRISEQTTTTVNVTAVRQSRVKIEQDVVKLHNRIHLLQIEEERALRMIDATRQKADKILRTRAE